MITLPNISAMRKWRVGRAAVGFVPTMGALHEGHLALMRSARAKNQSLVISIFVNPTQFGPKEDLVHYPRDLEGDLEKAASAAVDAVFVPSVEEMYPAGAQGAVMPGPLAEGLCGPFRPGHFAGVVTVVAKLFNIVQPNRAYFGEKDFQQLRVIEQMVVDLDFPVEIVRCPTVREVDGLAMSSRNRYLSPEDRQKAAAIYRVISGAAAATQSGERDARAMARTARLALAPIFDRIDYVSVVDPVTLQEIERIEGEARIAIAAWLGTTRLIDNGPLKVGGPK